VVWLNRSEMNKFIRSLSADEASQAIKLLLNENPDLMKRVYDCAVKAATAVDSEDICDEVFSCLDEMDIECLNGRAGSTSHGYVSPTDAAGELFEEAMAPFVVEIDKNHMRALPAVAKAYCIGIVEGLRKYENESKSDLKEWFLNEPRDYVFTVLGEWNKGNPCDEDVAEVMRVVYGDRS
jgi:hypothetical protein